MNRPTVQSQYEFHFENWKYFHSSMGRDHCYWSADVFLRDRVHNTHWHSTVLLYGYDDTITPKEVRERAISMVCAGKYHYPPNKCRSPFWRWVFRVLGLDL